MGNKVVVNIKQEDKIKQGHVLLRAGSVYMVSCTHKYAGATMYNLVNLDTGGRYTDPLTMTTLKERIEKDGFEVIGEVEIVINKKKFV